MAIPGDPEDIAPVIGELLAAYAAQRIDANSTAAKTAGYLEALYDIPHWAICEALARWRRGEAGSDIREEEYSFAPSTVRLRRLALRIAAVPAGQAVRMQRLLDAEPEQPLTTAQREEYERRAAEMAAEIAAGAGHEKHRTPGATPAERAEQEARDRETRAHWQRWISENGPKEQSEETDPSPFTPREEGVA